MNTYKTHAMATHHRGAAQPLDKESTPQEHGIDAPSNYNHEDMDNFKSVKQEKHTTLKALTRNLDELRLLKVNLWKL